jgi:hypothetical protein
MKRIMSTALRKAMPVRTVPNRSIGIPLILLFLLCLSGCSLPGLPDTSATKHAGQHIAGGEEPINASYQPHKTIDVWLNDTESYPRQYFNEAKQAIADAIDQGVQVNSGGMAIYINIITGNSWRPESTLFTITIPPISADPPAPLLQKQPTPTDDPYGNAANARAIDEENAQTLTAYQHILQEHHAFLAHIRGQVRHLTDQLRMLNPPVDDHPPDLWGMLERASQRLKGGNSQRMLIVVSGFDTTTWSEFTPFKTIWGVHVRVLWWYCLHISNCNDDFWRGAFLHAHASDVRMYDPAQSETLQNILS